MSSIFSSEIGNKQGDQSEALEGAENELSTGGRAAVSSMENTALCIHVSTSNFHSFYLQKLCFSVVFCYIIACV